MEVCRSGIPKGSKENLKAGSSHSPLDHSENALLCQQLESALTEAVFWIYLASLVSALFEKWPATNHPPNAMPTISNLCVECVTADDQEVSATDMDRCSFSIG